LFWQNDNLCGYYTLLITLLLVNDLVHLPYLIHQVFGAVAGDCWYFWLNNLNYLFLSIFIFSVIYYSAFYFFVFKNTKKIQKNLKIPKIFSHSCVISFSESTLSFSLFILVVINIFYFSVLHLVYCFHLVLNTYHFSFLFVFPFRN